MSRRPHPADGVVPDDSPGPAAVGLQQGPAPGWATPPRGGGWPTAGYGPASTNEITLHDEPLGELRLTIKANHEGRDGWLYLLACTSAEQEPPR